MFICPCQKLILFIFVRINTNQIMQLSTWSFLEKMLSDYIQLADEWITMNLNVKAHRFSKIIAMKQNNKIDLSKDETTRRVNTKYALCINKNEPTFLIGVLILYKSITQKKWRKIVKQQCKWSNNINREHKKCKNVSNVINNNKYAEKAINCVNSA